MRALSIRRAWRASWKTPGLTILVILTLSFGLAVWLATSSAVRAFENDPLRDVSGLYRVEIVRYDELRKALAGTDMAFVSETPQLVLAETEVQAFSASTIPTRVTPITASTLPVLPDGTAPSLERARYLGPEAFDLFRLHFAAGRPFSKHTAGVHELVISNEAARRWFGSASVAVGHDVKINGLSWRVAGVLVDHAAAGRRMHINDGATDPALWLPYEAAIAMHVVPSTRHAANVASGGVQHASLWVELPRATDFNEYLRFAAQTAARLRLPPSSVRLRSYREWSGVLGAPPTYRAFGIFGVIVLVACSFTLMRLLHTRFRLRTSEMAMRRAVGASRMDVLEELFAEAILIAAMGAGVGVILSAGVLGVLASLFPNEAANLRLQPDRVLVGLMIGIGVGLVAALIPAWRMCREPVAHALRRA